MTLCSVVLNAVVQDHSLFENHINDLDGITAADFKIYYALLNLSKEVYQKNDDSLLTDKGEPMIMLAQRKLAEQSGVSLITVRRSMIRLETVGLIHCKHQRGYGKTGNIITVLESFYDFITDEEYEKLVGKNHEEDDRVEEDLEQLHSQGLMTKQEHEIIDLSAHYNMLAREALGRGGYNSLSKRNPWKHKNWKYFVKLRSLCKENDWNSDQYLDCQFERAQKYWKNSRFKFPLPQMLCSEKAVFYFKDWRSNQDEIQEDNPKYNRNKARKTYRSVYSQIIEEVMQAAMKVDHHMQFYFDNRGYQHFQLVNEKMKYITENYWLFPASYLYTFAFIRKNPEKMIHHTTDYKYGYTWKSQDDIKHTFSLLSSNKKMAQVAIKSRKEIERSDIYFVPGSFDVLSKEASERYYRHSLLKLGYTNEQIDQDLARAHEIQRQESERIRNGGHVSAVNVMTKRKEAELIEEAEEEEEWAERESSD